MQKSLDRKLAAIHADPACREFILADAKDADMALGLGAPGQSPEMHTGEVRLKTLEDYRDQMRLITRSELVDIMLMSASSSHALTIRERLFDNSAVTPAVRANDTTDIHLARGATYSQAPSRPFRTASLDHIQCGHLECSADERAVGASLGLYSVTFNNDIDRDLATLEQFRVFREEAERKGFRYFLEVFDPNLKGAVAPQLLAPYINDMITRMLAGVAPSGRPLFLKMVYHGPRAMEELVRFDRHLIVGILGGSAGTTRDAFQLLHDAQKYGARVGLFGRKINGAENQLAFVHFLRLIVEGRLGPVEAVKAYHAVLARLGLRPHRNLDDDLKLTDQSMSYAGTAVSSGAALGKGPEPRPSESILRAAHVPSRPSQTDSRHCQCRELAAQASGAAAKCACQPQRPVVTESSHVARLGPIVSFGPARNSQHDAEKEAGGKRTTDNGQRTADNGHPDFARMSPPQRLAYHRQRLGLGR
jgi:hypothetical protein